MHTWVVFRTFCLRLWDAFRRRLAPVLPERWMPTDGPPYRRVSTPTVLQMEAAECGAAALAVVAGYFGRHVPLEEMRVLCGVSRDGSKASNLLKAGRSLGFHAKGFRLDPDELRTLPPPFIVHWNFKHFLVVEGITEEAIFVNDPALGPYTVSHDEFDESFTGIVLFFQPGPNFEEGGETQSLWRSLKRRLSGNGTGLAYALVTGLMLTVLGIIAAIFSKVYIDKILIRGLWDWLTPMMYVMGGAAAMLGGLTWLKRVYLLRMETKIALDTSSGFFQHLLRLPIEFFAQRYAGEISSRVALNDKVATIVSRQLATNVIGAATIVFYGLIMTWYSPLLTAIAVAVAALNVVALQLVARRRRDLNRRLLQERGKLTGVSMGGLQTIESIKAMGDEAWFFSRWGGYQAKMANAQQSFSIYTRLLRIVPSFLMAVTTAAILSVGGLTVIEGALSLGMLVAFQTLTNKFLNPISNLVNLGGQVQEVEGDLERLDDVLKHKPDPRVRLGAPPDDAATPALDDAPAFVEGRLTLDGVTFGYSRFDPPVVEDLNLELRPGQRVALVGPSGCGKSTVARLVAGLYDPWKGDIRFDGRSRNEVPRALMTEAFAFVDQEIFLFEGTVRENLTLWDPTIPDDRIIQAARDACIHDVILDRPGGYDGALDENGRDLSGGQRQRLEIARALVRDPRVLVLDEATSSLDPLTEKSVDDSVRRRGCTCLIVAHRLSTIRDCDEIVVLDEGRIAERGTHDTLMDQDGLYASLYAKDDGRRSTAKRARPSAVEADG